MPSFLRELTLWGTNVVASVSVYCFAINGAALLRALAVGGNLRNTVIVLRQGMGRRPAQPVTVGYLMFLLYYSTLGALYNPLSDIPGLNLGRWHIPLSCTLSFFVMTFIDGAGRL